MIAYFVVAREISKENCSVNQRKKLNWAVIIPQAEEKLDDDNS